MSHESPKKGEFLPEDSQPLTDALHYVNQGVADWVLRPDEVDVTQREDPDRYQHDFMIMLSQLHEGTRQLQMLGMNMHILKIIQASDSVAMAMRINGDRQGISSDQAYMQGHASNVQEIIQNAFQFNRMVDGFICMTNATVLRDDIKDGNDTGRRIYKGTIYDRPIYFVEHILPKVVEQDGQEATVLCRAVDMCTEDIATTYLEVLSDKEVEMLEGLGIEPRHHWSYTGDAATTITRTAMVDIIRLHADLSASVTGDGKE